MSALPDITRLRVDWGAPDVWDRLKDDDRNMLGWPYVGKCTTCSGPACMLFSTRDIAEYECRPNWPVDAAPGNHKNNVFKVYDL